MAHGGLSLVGKVKKHTPKVEKTIRTKKKLQGRAGARAKYNRRVLNAPRDHSGRPMQPNKQQPGKLG